MSRRGKITKRRETDGESRLESESEAIEKPQTGGNTMEIALAKLVEILMEKSKEGSSPGKRNEGEWVEKEEDFGSY